MSSPHPRLSVGKLVRINCINYSIFYKVFMKNLNITSEQQLGIYLAAPFQGPPHNLH